MPDLNSHRSISRRSGNRFAAENATTLLERDPEKLADFSGKIMRPCEDEKKRDRFKPTNRALVQEINKTGINPSSPAQRGRMSE